MHEDNIKVLKELLTKGKVIVTFTKVDGTERRMLCTLAKDLLPKMEEPKPLKEGEEPKKKRKVNPNVLPVWDLEAEGWRSFKFDNVTEFVVY